jgi:hypothetical protein
MKLKKCPGYLASQIRWGIELETRIPTTADVQVGNYHGGQAVHVGIHAETTLPLNPPNFQGSRWKAEQGFADKPEPRSFPAARQGIQPQQCHLHATPLPPLPERSEAF